MDISIREAARLVNSNIVYVAIVAALSARTLYIKIPDLFWVALIASLFVEVVIFSKFIATIDGAPFRGYLYALKRNSFNYLLVYIILFVFIITLTMLVNLLNLESLAFIIVNSGIKMLIIMLTIYVLPILFIKHTHVLSIASGVAYLFSNVEKSKVILFLALLIFIIEVASVLLISNSVINMSLLTTYAVTISIIDTYMQFLIFVMAVMVLLNMPNKALVRDAGEKPPAPHS